MKYANFFGYSDIDPYKVIRVVSEKCLEVQEMIAKLDEVAFKPEFVTGGFSAICVNQYEQKWNIESDVNGRVIRIRLGKDGVWKDRDGRKFGLSDQPCKFYDYNF